MTESEVPVVVLTDIPNTTCRRGKVRDVYELDAERLLIVTTDRISAFDWVLPNGIPGKGSVLTALTLFWLQRLHVPNHLLTTDLSELPPPFTEFRRELLGRSLIVRKTNVVPFECVVRGYLAGSSWKEYRQSGTVCGISFPPGLRLAQQLAEPIFTPAIKAEAGHDENVSFERMVERLGRDLAETLRSRSLDLYKRAAAFALERGIIIADTKFEWGLLPNGEILLIDEVLTPDSSRFWAVDTYAVGTSPPSFDKQYVRDWLDATTWDKNSPPPELPPDVIAGTAAKYAEALTRLTQV